LPVIIKSIRRLGEEIRVAWKTEEMGEVIELMEIAYRDGRLNGTSSCRYWWQHLVLTLSNAWTVVSGVQTAYKMYIFN
jgi:hypothetical protein